MKVFNSVLFILMLFAVLGFSILNSQQTVDINLYWKHYYNVSMVIALFIAFMIGLIFWFLISTANNLVLRSNNRMLNRKIRELKEELRELRNASLLDDPEENNEELPETLPAKLEND